MGESMRVLALVTEAFGGYGGIAQYNRDLLAALSQVECVSEVLVLPRFGTASLCGLPAKVTQHPPTKSKARYAASAIAAVRRMGRQDVIFCGHLHSAPLADAMARITHLPIWLQVHGIDAWAQPPRITRNAAEKAALVTAVSRYTRSKVLSWAILDPSRVRVLPNTVRRQFTPGPTDDAVIRRLGLTGSKIILTVARINKGDWQKGHSKVIEALPSIRKRYPDSVYVVVGEGDGRHDLEQLVARHGLERSVRFVGRLEDDEMLALYRAARVFVMPSRKEGFGIAFAEAAAAGLPVIAGNRDGSVDALADGVLGRLIDPDSHDQIVAAIIDAFEGRLQSQPEGVQRFAFKNFAKHVDELVRNYL